eukprot:m.740879 g.740879  ORF g.740879 m.740879 type:complete len:2074 (-) comp58934_c0_seq2:142-6363(-)
MDPKRRAPPPPPGTRALPTSSLPTSTLPTSSLPTSTFPSSAHTASARPIDRAYSERLPAARTQPAIPRSHSHSQPSGSKLLSNKDFIKSAESRQVANALAHGSPHVRLGLLAEVNQHECNRVAIARSLIDILSSKDEMLAYQTVAAAFLSLSGLDLRSRSSSPPAAFHDSLIDTFVDYLVGKDEVHIPVVIDVLGKMSLRTHVVLRLLDWLDRHCQSTSVYRALCAIKLIDVATPEIIVRIVMAMHHFSPSPFVSLESGVSEPSCMDSALDVLQQFPDVSYNIKVLETFDNLLKKPPVYATKNHAPTQRRKYVTTLLVLLQSKFAPRIKKFQQSQQATQARVSQVYESRIESTSDWSSLRDAQVHDDSENPTSNLYASVLSTVQDFLSDRELVIRKAAIRFVRSVSLSSVFCKVVCQQIVWWLQSDKAADQRAALTDMVALAFRPSSLLDTILTLLENEEARSRQAAITCLHHHVVEVQTEEPTDFADMVGNVKEHISQVFTHLMQSDLRTPTLDMFTESKESDTTKMSAFKLLFHSQHLSHPAVCNAVLAIESSSDELVESALQYLVMAALIAAKPEVRAPALSALTGLMSEAQTLTKLKLLLISLAVAMREASVSFDLIQQATVLLTDKQATVRTEAAKMFEAYFHQELKQPATSNSHLLQHVLLEMFRSELVNAMTVNQKVVAMQSLAQLKISNAVLEFILISLLDHPDITIKTTALNTLADLHIHSAQAINKAKKYLHASVDALKDAASVFVFTAASIELRVNHVVLYDNEIINTAIWCLATDQRDKDELISLRKAALLFLREIARQKVEENSIEDGNVKTDEFNLKQCLYNYLHNNAKRDTATIQRFAWRFFVEFFIMEAADYKLLAESFRSSRLPSPGRSRQTFDRDVMVDTLALVEVRSQEDFEYLVHASVGNELMAFVHANSLLVYASSTEREAHHVKLPVVDELRETVPLVGMLLLNAFKNEPKDASPSTKQDDDVIFNVRPAASRPLSLAMPSHFVVDDILAPRSTAAPPTPQHQSVPTSASPKRQQSDLDPDEASGKLSSALQQLENEHERFTVAQKAFRDEKRARLLVEEKCRELMTEMKKLRTKYDSKVRTLNEIQETPGSAPVPPKRKGSQRRPSGDGAATAQPGQITRSQTLPSQPSAPKRERSTWDKSKHTSLVTMEAPDSAEGQQVSDTDVGTSAVKPHTSLVISSLKRSDSSSSQEPPASPKKPAATSQAKSHSSAIESGSESESPSEDEGAHHDATKKKADTPSKPDISGPMLAEAKPMLSRPELSAPIKEEVKRLQAARFDAASSLRKLWGKPERTSSMRSILQDLNTADDYVTSSSDESESETEAQAKLAQQRMALIQIEQIRMELEQLDAESDEEQPSAHATESQVSPVSASSGSSDSAAQRPLSVTQRPQSVSQRPQSVVVQRPQSVSQPESVVEVASAAAQSESSRAVSARTGVKHGVLVMPGLDTGVSLRSVQRSASLPAQAQQSAGGENRRAAVKSEVVDPDAVKRSQSPTLASGSSTSSSEVALADVATSETSATVSAVSVRQSWASSANKRVSFATENEELEFPRVEYQHSSLAESSQDPDVRVAAALELSSNDAADQQDADETFTDASEVPLSDDPLVSEPSAPVNPPLSTMVDDSASALPRSTKPRPMTVYERPVPEPPKMMKTTRTVLGRRRLPDPRGAIYDSLLKDEQTYVARLQLATQHFNAALRSFESSHLIEKGDYPIARFLAVFERVVGLHVMLVQGLYEVMKEMPVTLPDISAIAKLFSDYALFFQVYVRYQHMYSAFLGTLTQLEAKHSSAFIAMRDKCAKEIIEGARAEQEAGEISSADFGSWYKEPIARMASLRSLFEKLHKFSTTDSHRVSMAETLSFMKQVTTDMGDANKFDAAQAEFKRLVQKKFKSSCPSLFSTIRLFIKRWTFVEVKTKQTEFLPKFEEGASDLDSDTVSTASLGDNYESDEEAAPASALKMRPVAHKAGTEVKIYLFNDSVLIAGKKLGSAYCKAFIGLHDVSVLDSSPNVNIFGLKIEQKGKTEVNVFQAASLDEKKDFLFHLKVENCIFNQKISS